MTEPPSRLTRVIVECRSWSVNIGFQLHSERQKFAKLRILWSTQGNYRFVGKGTKPFYEGVMFAFEVLPLLSKVGFKVP
jgi:hypothetical protein